MPAPEAWRAADGSVISCREKLRVLEENRVELAQAMQDAFEDGVLMGVEEGAMRESLLRLVEALQSPCRRG